jgi:hypothetical protein
MIILVERMVVAIGFLYSYATQVRSVPLAHDPRKSGPYGTSYRGDQCRCLEKILELEGLYQMRANGGVHIGDAFPPIWQDTMSVLQDEICKSSRRSEPSWSEMISTRPLLVSIR